MMKRMLIVSIALAVVASSAMAASIIRLDPLSTATGATTSGYMISQSGRYVGGSTTDPYDGLISAGLYDLSTSTWTTIPNSDKTAPLSGIVTGVAHVTGGSLYAAGNMNDNANRTYGQANQFGRPYNGTTGSTGNFSPTSDTMVGQANYKDYVAPSGNSVRSTADGTDSWICAHHSQGANSKGNEAYIYKGSTGNTAYATANSGRNNTKLILSGISSTGRAVGYDAFSAARTACYVEAGAGGTVTALAVGLVPNYASNQNSIAWGISDDGAYITGYQKTTLTTRPQAFLWHVGDANATLLPDLNGTVNNNSYQSFASAVANDGTVVGYTWVSGVTKNACVWFPGAAKPDLLWDIAVAQGIDLTGWTTLGTGAASIEKLGTQYYILGNGTYNGAARAFVLVIPEPATLGLLAFGGLAMLRRRR